MFDPLAPAATLWETLAAVARQPDHPLTHRAYAVATQAHAGQRRHEGVPYIVHPLRVALRLAGRGWQADDLLAAALLHDVIEDSALTQDDLAGDFGAEVATWVALLTKPPRNGRPPDWEARYYAAIAAAPRPVRLIKCADRLDNLLFVGVRGPEKAATYRAESRAYIVPIAAMTDDEWHRELVALSATAGAGLEGGAG